MTNRIVLLMQRGIVHAPETSDKTTPARNVPDEYMLEVKAANKSNESEISST